MPAQEFTRMSQSRLIGTIALVTWLLVALPVLLYHMPDGSMSWQWIAVYLSFGMLFALDLRRPRLLLLALASAAALYLVVLRCNGYEGALLALVAMQLGTRVRHMSGIAWILGQTALLGIADAITFNPHAARLLLPPYLGLQLVAFFVFDAMAREVAARTALAASNAELRGVGQILADTSRRIPPDTISGSNPDSYRNSRVDGACRERAAPREAATDAIGAAPAPWRAPLLKSQSWRRSHITVELVGSVHRYVDLAYSVGWQGG
jgi:hypothetical protein